MDFGGAATACKRIHLSLLKNGVDSKMLVLHKTKNIEKCFSFFQNSLPLSKRIMNKLKRWGTVDPQLNPQLNKLRSQVEVFTFPDSKYDITEHALYKEADIIQLNWVSGFLDEKSFFRKNKKPVIWRMPDLYACGGGYHYEKFFPFSELSPLLEANTRKRKAALINVENLTFIPISKWVNEKAEASDVIRYFRREIIHNGVDLTIFKKIDKAFAREFLNLPVDKKIVLFGAESIHNRRKGFSLLQNAMQSLNLKDCFLCVFGHLPPDTIAHDHKDLGVIQDERLLSIVYSAADVFVNPSLEEAFGQVTIESIACGTPVVSFPTGGSKDVIIDDLNGLLASDFSDESLTQALEKALNANFDSDLIREDAAARFDIDKKALDYISIYNSVLA